MSDKKRKSHDEKDENVSKRSKKTAVNSGAKPLLSGKEHEDLKRFLRERKKFLVRQPHFELTTVGLAASMSDGSQPTPAGAILASDVQLLLMYLMMGDKMQAADIGWASVQKWNNVSNVVCLIVDGNINAADMSKALKEGSSPDSRPFALRLSPVLHHKLEMVPPQMHGSSALREICTILPSKRRLEAIRSVYRNAKKFVQLGAGFTGLRSSFPIKKVKDKPKSRQKGTTNSLKLRLILSVFQMAEEGYPMPLVDSDNPSYNPYKEFLFTSDSYDEVGDDSPMFSVDCEMCRTTAGRNELTRISVVNERLEQVYHSLVMPPNPIIDFLTRYSGITKDMLEGVTTTLEDVQAELRRILPPNCILVGQGLNNDLLALRLMHPYIIDTSVIYNVTGVRWRKSKLSLLSKVFLGEEIQKHGEKGHNPIEDSVAAMKLVNLKLRKGYDFGDVLLGGYVGDEASRKSADKDEEIMLLSAITEIRDQNKNVSVICQEDVVERHSEIPGVADARTAEKAKEAVAMAVEAADDPDNDLVMCNVRLQGDKVGSKQWKKLDKWTRTLWSKVRPNGVLVTVWSGGVENNGMVGVSLKKQELPEELKRR